MKTDRPPATASRRLQPRLEGLRPRSPAKPDWDAGRLQVSMSHALIEAGGREIRLADGRRAPQAAMRWLIKQHVMHQQGG